MDAVAMTTYLDNNEEVLVRNVTDACNIWLHCPPCSGLASQLQSLSLHTWCQ